MARNSTNIKGAPQFVRFFGPMIRALQDLGGSGRPDEVRARVAQMLGLSEEAQSAPLPSGVLPAAGSTTSANGGSSSSQIEFGQPPR